MPKILVLKEDVLKQVEIGCFGSTNIKIEYKVEDFDMELLWRKDSGADFDLYRFMTTGWYYGYKGSITVPPCREDVHWRILDLPMKISKQQTNRMKYLLQNSLDSNCQYNSASFDNEVNRPIQHNQYQNIWRCAEEDWGVSDDDPIYWFENWPEDYHAWPED